MPQTPSIVYCSLLQCVTVCCSVLQSMSWNACCTAMQGPYCNTRAGSTQHALVAAWCSWLQLFILFQSPSLSFGMNSHYPPLLPSSSLPYISLSPPYPCHYVYTNNSRNNIVKTSRGRKEKRKRERKKICGVGKCARLFYATSL